MRRVLLSWSSGKDSAWALHLLREIPDLQVVGLVTSFTSSADRVAMHAVRRSLVEAQAERVGLPLWSVQLPSPCSNTVYEQLMSDIWKRAVAEDVKEVAFGDLFLQDIREYRERQLHQTGLSPIFPVWHLPTLPLAQKMIRAGVKAKITCVDPQKLDRTFAGRDFDDDLIRSLPPTVDPCGENGEFHTFVYGSPAFSSSIPVTGGEVLERDGFVFADVLPIRPTPPAGLCATCSNSQVMKSDRSSLFYRCLLSETNPHFAKYPRLPVTTCSAWRPGEATAH